MAIDPDRLIDLGKALVDAAGKQSLCLRLFGAIGVRAHCEKSRRDILVNRYYNSDIDFFADVDQPLEIDSFLRKSSSHVSEDRAGFRAGEKWTYRYLLSGNQDLGIDVYFGRIRFNHSFRPPYFHDRDLHTISITSLLLLKLGIAETFGIKDQLDTIAILREHDLGQADDPEIIKISLLCKAWCDGASGWCLARTCSKNLEIIQAQLAGDGMPSDVKESVGPKLDFLKRLIDRCRKSFCWKTRDLIGEEFLGISVPYFSPAE